MGAKKASAVAPEADKARESRASAHSPAHDRRRDGDHQPGFAGHDRLGRLAVSDS